MKQRKPMFSLDVLALALLTCLLASVVGMLVMGEDGNSVKQRKALLEKTAEITKGGIEAQTTQIELSKQIEQRAELSRLEREQRIAQSEADELGRTIMARTAIAGTEAEIARLRDELGKTKREQDETPGRRQIVGNYRGSYILIECVKGHALVYPGKTKLPKKPDDKTLQQLVDRISQAGFVVFVVRPEGWYDDSYDSLRSLVDPLLAKVEQTSDKKIGRTWFPLESKEPIKPYLPSDPTATASTPPEEQKRPAVQVHRKQPSRS